MHGGHDERAAGPGEKRANAPGVDPGGGHAARRSSALNVVGWVLLALAVGGHYHITNTEIFGFGTGALAYTLGFRHAFDADHISAIDNTTRKLMADGKRPLGSGFFFSLGHSTIVVAVGVGITSPRRPCSARWSNPNSAYETVGGIIGTLLSGGFLYLIAAAEPDRAGRHLQGVPGDAQRHLQRGAAGGPAAGARPDVPLLRPVHAVDQPHLADVLRRPRLRHRLRHRHRGRPAGAGRGYAGDPACRSTRCLSLPLLFAGGHELFDTARRLLHELRLRLGVRQARSARSTTTSSSPACRSSPRSSSAPSRSSAC